MEHAQLQGSMKNKSSMKRPPTLMARWHTGCSIYWIYSTLRTQSEISLTSPWHRESCSQARRSIAFRIYSYNRWSSWTTTEPTTTETSVGSSVASRAAKGNYSVKISVRPGHARYINGLLATQFVGLPWPGSFYEYLFIPWLKAKSIFCLQLLYSWSRGTSIGWIIPTRPTSRRQPLSV